MPAPDTVRAATDVGDRYTTRAAVGDPDADGRARGAESHTG